MWEYRVLALPRKTNSFYLRVQEFPVRHVLTRFQHLLYLSDHVALRPVFVLNFDVRKAEIKTLKLPALLRLPRQNQELVLILVALKRKRQRAETLFLIFYHLSEDLYHKRSRKRYLVFRNNRVVRD